MAVAWVVIAIAIGVKTIIQASELSISNEHFHSVRDFFKKIFQLPQGAQLFTGYKYDFSSLSSAANEEAKLQLIA